MLGLGIGIGQARRWGGGGGGPPTLAVKPTAYEPVGEIGTNNTALRQVAGWTALTSAGATDAGRDEIRTYTGGLIGNAGAWGDNATAPGTFIIARDSGSTDHVFRLTYTAGTTGNLHMCVAATNETNCVYAAITFASTPTGSATIAFSKRDSTGAVSLGSYSVATPVEVERALPDRLFQVNDTLEIQILGQRLHAFLNGKRLTPHAGLDLDTTRAFTKGTYCGFGTRSTSSTFRCSTPYIAPLVTTLALASTSQFTDYAVFWPGTPGTGRSIAVSGTWTGEKPTGLRYRVLNDSTGAVIQDWAYLSGATIGDGAGSGTWSASCAVPMSDTTTNPKMRIQVGSYGDADACTMTPKGAAVGYLVAVYGQSNANGWIGTGATSYTPSAYAYAHDASNGWTGGTAAASTNKARKLGGVLAPLLGIPVGVAAFGPSGKHVYELNVGDSVSAGWSTFYNAGDATDTRYLDNFIAFLQHYRVNGYGYAQQLVWVQGEAEASDGVTNEATYRASFDTLLTALRGGIAASSTTPVHVAVIGSYTGGGANGVDANWTLQRAILSRLTDKTAVYHAVNNFDAAMFDSYHYTPNAVAEEARRVGLSIAKLLTLSSYDGRGPRVTSAARSGATITLSLDLNGATGLAAATGLTFYEVNSASDFTGTSYAVSSADVSGNTIVLGLGATPAGPVYVRSFAKSNITTGAVIAKGDYADGTQIGVEPIYAPILSN